MINKIQEVPKIIFVDFDNTLAAHQWSEQVEGVFFSQDDGINWDSICKTNPNTYNECQPVPCVVRAINFFRQKGSRIILLGWENKHFTRKLKEQWVEHYFPGVFEEKIFTGSTEQKIKVMEMFSITEGINRKEIAIIEDRPSTCDHASREGFLAWSLAFIALIFDTQIPQIEI